MRVYELAAELNVASSTLLDATAASGRSLRSASSEVPPGLASQLRAQFATRQAPTTSALPAAAGNADPDTEESRLLAYLTSGSKLPPPRRRAAPARHAGRPRVPTARAGSLAAELQARWPVSTTEAEKLVRAWLAGTGKLTSGVMAVETVREWWKAGLGAHDYAIAWACLDAGLAPSDLTRVLDGTSALKRLRGGESVGSVVARLRIAG